MIKPAQFSIDYVRFVTLVEPFFNGSTEKATLWMETVNPMLGGVSPRRMLELGRADRLLIFLRHAEEEREPEMTTPTATPSADDPYPWLARGAIPPYQPPFPG